MSGTGQIGKTTNRTDEVVSSQTQEEREAIWGPIPGKVVSYDAAKQTATIQPLYKPKHNGKPIDMPELLEVPIKFPRTGQGAITHPIPAGTRVMLEPTMRSGENYHAEDDGEASDTRSFNLSDMEANLAGGDTLTDPLPNVDPNVTHIRANHDGTHGLKLHPSGLFEWQGAEGDVYALHQEAVDLCAEGFTLLGTEPALVHVAEYASIGSQLQAISDKLAAMKL